MEQQEIEQSQSLKQEEVNEEGGGGGEGSLVNPTPTTEKEAVSPPAVAQEEEEEEEVEVEGVLSKSLLRKGLHTLGRGAYDLRLVYLGLNLENQGLSSIERIAQYPNIETVNLSQNKLTDLSTLSALPHLTYLDASSNQLTQALDFEPPKCDAILGGWNQGDRWIGSSLVEASLAHNNISSLRDLYWHKYLKILDLSHNHLKEIQGLEGLKFLERLDLSHNHIQRIQGLSHCPLVSLYLNHNELESLEGFFSSSSSSSSSSSPSSSPTGEGGGCVTPTTLQTLEVANNKITSLSPLARMKRLRGLDVGENLLMDVKEIEALASLPFLLALRLEGNPFINLTSSSTQEDHHHHTQEGQDSSASSSSRDPHYRARVLVRLGQVGILDGIYVDAKEKVHALNIHAVPGLSDFASRRRHWQEQFPPEQPFVDLLPPIEKEVKIGSSSSASGYAAAPTPAVCA